RHVDLAMKTRDGGILDSKLAAREASDACRARRQIQRRPRVCALDDPELHARELQRWRTRHYVGGFLHRSRSVSPKAPRTSRQFDWAPCWIQVRIASIDESGNSPPSGIRAPAGGVGLSFMRSHDCSGAFALTKG